MGQNLRLGCSYSGFLSESSAPEDKRVRPVSPARATMNCNRHMVPTPMGLSLLAAFEELDAQCRARKSGFRICCRAK